MSDLKPCQICESTEEPTCEHIIPQTLLLRWDVDPQDAEWERLRTDLCKPCNKATSGLHNNNEGVMDAFVDGKTPSKGDAAKLAVWAVWVTMLLGVSHGRSIWPVKSARKLLLDRFAGKEAGGPPKGTRVYAAWADEEVIATGGKSYAIARMDDPAVVHSYDERPVGFRVGESCAAAIAMRIGKVFVLVVPPTYSSGPDHRYRMDVVADEAGFTRIHPPLEKVVKLRTQTMESGEIGKLFVTDPLSADDLSLLPTQLRELMEALARG